MNKVLSKKQLTHLFDHILDGHLARVKGLKKLLEQELINKEEYTDYLERNEKELSYKLEDFKLREKLFSIFFAGLFTLLQVIDLSGDDMVRRAGRRSGRKKYDSEQLSTSYN